MTLYYEDETVNTVVGQVALEMSHKFRGVTEADDVTQELWLWAHKKQARIEENMGKDSFQPWLRTSLRNAARDYIASTRQSSGSLLDQEWYNQGQIKELLPAVWDDDYLLGSGNQSETKISGGGDPSTGGNWLASCMDVRSAYKKLSDFYKEVLRLRFAEEWTYVEMADHYGRGVSTMDYHVNQALKAIQRELGGAKPYEGGRRAMSNAHSRAVQSHYYDGEN